jgi:hypothetical protein
MDVELHAWSWLIQVLWALGLLALVAVAVWTLVRAPGRRQDPGLRGGSGSKDPDDRDDRDRPPPG